MNHINILVENEIMRTMGTSFLAAESLAMANGICFRSHKCMRKKKNQGYKIFGLKSYCSNYSVFGNPITLNYDIFY